MADIVVLVSGGLDSTVAAAMLRSKGDVVHPLHILYEHPALRRESQAVSDLFGLDVERRGVDVDPATDGVIFPLRNALFLLEAARVALRRGFRDVAIGCTFADSARFPDCRSDFLISMSVVLGAYGIMLHAPLQKMSRAEVRACAMDFEINVAMCWSCYGPGPDPCGECLSCRQ